MLSNLYHCVTGHIPIVKTHLSLYLMKNNSKESYMASPYSLKCNMVFFHREGKPSNHSILIHNINKKSGLIKLCGVKIYVYCRVIQIRFLFKSFTKFMVLPCSAFSKILIFITDYMYIYM